MPQPRYAFLCNFTHQKYVYPLRTWFLGHCIPAWQQQQLYFLQQHFSGHSLTYIFPSPRAQTWIGWTRTGSLFCAAELAPNSKETTKSRTEEEHEEGEGRTAWDGRRRQADHDRARSAFAPQPRVCLIKSLFPTAPPRPPRHGRGLRFACLSGKRIGRPGE